MARLGRGFPIQPKRTQVHGAVFVSAAQGTAYESLALASASRGAAYESLAALASTRATAYESLAALAATQGTAYESLALALAARATAYESLALALQSGLAAYESLAQAVQSGLVAYESLSITQQAQLTAYEVLGPATSPVSASALVAYESLALAAHTLLSAYESLGTVSRSQAVADESLGPVVATRGVADESLASAVQSLLTAYESLAPVQQSRLAAFEALALAQQSRLTAYEALGVPTFPVSATQLTAFEALGWVAAVLQIPYEILSASQTAAWFHRGIRSALRQELLSLVKAQTAAVPLTLTVVNAASVLVARTDGGSFVDDGFAAGDELTAAGWNVAGYNANWFVIALTDESLLLAIPFGGAAPTTSDAATVTLTAGLPSAQADENITFTTTPGQCWFREDYRAGPTQRQSMGPFARVRLDFQYAVTVAYPAGSGALGIDGMGDALRQLLSVGRELSYNGQSLTILQASRQGFAQDADWVSMRFTVRGFAYTFTS